MKTKGGLIMQRPAKPAKAWATRLPRNKVRARIRGKDKGVRGEKQARLIEGKDKVKVGLHQNDLPAAFTVQRDSITTEILEFLPDGEMWWWGSGVVESSRFQRVRCLQTLVCVRLSRPSSL